MMRPTLIRFGIAVAFLVVAAGAFWWWEARIQTLETKTTDLSSSIQSKRDALALATQAKASLASLANDEASVNAYFVSQTDIVSFLSMLQSAGHTAGATVSIVQVSSGGTKTQPMLTIAAKVTGSFDAVMRTVGAIETEPYYVTTKNLTLDGVAANAPTTGRKNAVAKSAQWTASMTLTVGSDNATSTPVAVATTTATTTTP